MGRMSISGMSVRIEQRRFPGGWSGGNFVFLGGGGHDCSSRDERLPAGNYVFTNVVTTHSAKRIYSRLYNFPITPTIHSSIPRPFYPGLPESTYLKLLRKVYKLTFTSLGRVVVFSR